ncbi:MAG: cysteine desulfurase [Kiritimatiellae bacterium]|nr:cysteine desulfurase [Kiritimatiellia bacterium]
MSSPRCCSCTAGPPGRPRWDVEAARRDFPVLQQTVRGRPLVYLDNAATSQKPAEVIQAVCEYYGTCNANVHRAFHFLAEEATRRYEDVRRRAAAFFGAGSPREVVFTRGTTESINLVAWGWGRKHLRPDDAIVLTEMEHHSNLVPWQMVAAATGARLRFVPVLGDGTLDLAALDQHLADGRARIVAVTHASNVLGTVNPVAEIARRAHRAGALCLVDGAQSAPHLPISVRDLECDFYVCSGHKMYGPTGVGLLIGRAALLEAMDPFMGGGEMIDRVELERSTWAEVPHKFEAGTPNISAVIGLGAAIAYLERTDRDAITAWEADLTQQAIRTLSGMPGVHVFGSAAERLGVISFSVDGVHPHDLAQFLDGEGIAVRAGHLCCQPLMRRLGVVAVTRASLALYNTPLDIERLGAAIVRARAYFCRGA